MYSRVCSFYSHFEVYQLSIPIIYFWMDHTVYRDLYEKPKILKITKINNKFYDIKK